MEYQIKNYMEEYVMAMIRTHISKIDVCQCNECRMDIMAIVLNAMPQKYVVTRMGEIYTKLSMLEQQHEVDCIKEILKASEIVKAFPRHGK